MKKGIRFEVCVAVAMCAALSLPALAAPADVTVGAFVVKLASLRDPMVRDFVAAGARLKADGVSLPALDPKKTLTQADVVAIGNAAGLRLTTSNPSAPFDQPSVDGLLAAFGNQLQSGGRSGSKSQSPMGGGDQGGNGQGGNGQGGNGQGGNGQGGNGQGGHQKSQSNPQ